MDLKPTAQVAATIFGWPAAGGVWVLRPTTVPTRDNLPVTTDMEEHCAILESLGAIFYQNPNECEEVRQMMESLPRNHELRTSAGNNLAPSSG